MSKFIGFILLFIVGCGTTSKMKCKKYVGIEKEQCLQSYQNYVNNLDYLSFRGGKKNIVRL